MRSVERTIDEVSPSAAVQLRLLKKRLHRDMTLRVIRGLVHPGDEVLDVGAYRGVYTLALSRQVGRRGRVWSIEAFPPNASVLRSTMARRPNVTVCPWAASATTGRRTLAVPVYEGHRLGALASFGTPAVGHEALEVETRSVDDLVSRPEAGRPLTFVRCDVVGHEADVLSGAERLLLQHRPALFVEIEQRHQSTPVQATFDRLRGHGYDGYFLKERRFFPLGSFDLERDQLSYLDSGFVPYGMPSGYVHYFMFVSPQTDLGSLPVLRS